MNFGKTSIQLNFFVFLHLYLNWVDVLVIKYSLFFVECLRGSVGLCYIMHVEHLIYSEEEVYVGMSSGEAQCITAVRGTRKKVKQQLTFLYIYEKPFVSVVSFKTFF